MSKVKAGLLLGGVALILALGLSAHRMADCVRPQPSTGSTLPAIQTFFVVLGGLGGLSVIGKFLLWVWNRLTGSVGNARLPAQQSFRRPGMFFPLFTIGMIATFAGGLLWNLVNRVNENLSFMCESAYSGGTLEPHGVAAVLWPAITMAPVLLAAGAILTQYRSISWTDHYILSVWFLVGMCFASWVFYDLPTLDQPGGVREWITDTKLSVQGELVLAFLWASSLSLLSYGLMHVIAPLIRQSPTLGVRSSEILLTRIGLCTGVVLFGVAMVLVALPLDTRSDFARGFIAGIGLRLSLFVVRFL